MYFSKRYDSSVLERPKPTWAIEEKVTSETNPKAIRGSLNLLQATQHNLEEKTIYRREVKKLLSTIGVEENSKIDLFLNPATHRIEIHSLNLFREGQAFDLLTEQEVQTFDLELEADNHVFSGRLRILLLLKDTRVGDIIDFSYSFVDIGTSHLSSISGRFLMHGPEETLKISAKILYQPERKVFAQPINCSIEPTLAYGPSGLVECKWEVVNPPRIETEHGTPSWHNAFAWIDYSEYASWSEVVARECDVFAVSDKLPEELENLVARFRSESAHDEAFILKALAFVQEEIRYVSISVGEHAWRPHSLEVILARRYGDCKDKSLMLHNLLSAAGIPSTIALVHTERGNSINSWLPNPCLFNHVIVRVTHDNRYYWLDSTSSGERGLLSRRPCPEFGKALLISPDTTHLIDIIPNYQGHQNRIRTTETFKTSKTFAPVELVVSKVYEGRPANSMRLKLANSNDAELVRFFTMEYSTLYPGIKCIGIPGQQEVEATNSITINLTFSLTDFWKKLDINPAYVWTKLSLGSIQKLLHHPDIRARKSPLVVPHPIHLSHTLILRTSKPFRNSRRSSTIKSPAFECQLKSESSSTYFQLSAEYASKTDHICPNDFAAHATACLQLMGALEEIFYLPKD